MDLGDIAKGVMDAVTGALGGHKDEEQDQNVLSSNQDQYGDPDAQGENVSNEQNIQSSNQDPYGDPDAQGENVSNDQNIQSSNQDPYGDPDAK